MGAGVDVFRGLREGNCLRQFLGAAAARARKKRSAQCYAITANVSGVAALFGTL